MRLRNIATVSSGVSFRDRVVASPSGNMSVIQMKDIGRDNRVRFERVTRMDHSMPRSHPRQLARPGDLVFRSRGRTNMAALLTEEAQGMAVAMPLFRIRPNRNKVAPEYLLWWMNQPSSQRYFASQSEGTFVKMINKQSLENLEVKLPPLAVQHKIAALFDLAEQEQRLLEAIKQRKKLQAHGILMRMASESRLTASNETPGADGDPSSPGSYQPHSEDKTMLTTLKEIYSSINREPDDSYEFVPGTFTIRDGTLRDQSGAYVILGNHDHSVTAKVIDVGEADKVKTRIDTHDRKDCWRRESRGGRVGVAAFYADEKTRKEIQDQLRKKYNPPCGEKP